MLTLKGNVNCCHGSYKGYGITMSKTLNGFKVDYSNGKVSKSKFYGSFEEARKSVQKEVDFEVAFNKFGNTFPVLAKNHSINGSHEEVFRD